VTYWPFYIGGPALALTALVHWLLTGRLMSVSSRFSALVDRARGAPAGRDGPESHLAFLGGISLGGLTAAIVAETFEPTLFDVGARFASTFGSDPITTALWLVVGGALVGAGTRMATGCTSGHGLCGVARFERGSLLATASFFGTGIVVAMLVREIVS
jgi:uncharacterized membrane protein YedE/YeeE